MQGARQENIIVAVDWGRRLVIRCSADVSQIRTVETELAWLFGRMVSVLQRVDEQVGLDQQQQHHQQ